MTFAPLTPARFCANPACQQPLKGWALDCKHCGWIECHACGTWFKPIAAEFDCPACMGKGGKS